MTNLSIETWVILSASILLVIALVGFLLLSIRRTVLRDTNMRSVRLGVSVIATTFVLIVLTKLLLLAPGGSYVPVDLAPYQLAVAQIEAGTLVPDASGVVTLPPNLASTAIDGEALITVRPDGKHWILFRIHSGKAANMTGYLYTAGDEVKDSQVSLLTRSIGELVPDVEIEIDRPLDHSWYVVSRSLD